MKKKKSDFLVGIVILTSIVILFAGVIWLKGMKLAGDKATYTALVPEVGGLQAGDPVKVNGVGGLGSVKKVYLKDSKVAIEFQLADTIDITDSCAINVKNIGLLGERKLEITLHEKGEKHSPDAEAVTNYIPGGFDPGIAEAIGMLGELMEDAKGLLDTVEYVVEETFANPEFVTFFDRTIDRVDTIAIVTENLLTTNDDKISKLITDLKASGKMLRAVVDDNDETISNIAGNFEGFSEQAQHLGNRVDTLMNHLESVAAKIDTGDGAVAQLLNESTLTEQLEKTLQSIDSLVDVTDKKGLKLRIKLGFGESSKHLEEK